MVRTKTLVLCLLAAFVLIGQATASSHMDAPLITLDDPANTTDVYAFRSNSGGVEYLTAALAVYPFEEPGIGPNKYNFDDNVLYEIHLAPDEDVAAGRKTVSYQFEFATTFQNPGTILQSYLCTVVDAGDGCQNLIQTYTVRRIDHGPGKGKGKVSVLGSGLLVPPNNQGLFTPFYNQGNDGEAPAKGGVADPGDLDPYTAATIHTLPDGTMVFAGQRDDGFYADIQSVFDDLAGAFAGPNKAFDSQGGYNVHTIVVNIPLSSLDWSDATVGVYATTSRQKVTVLRGDGPKQSGKWVQVGRQGNPLFAEGFIPIQDKDLYNRTEPTRDAELFAAYAASPQLSAALGVPPVDLTGIFIPDLIRVDVTTPAARLAGDPDDVGFSRLSVVGGDTLTNGDGVDVPGGFPNGRRFGDDVVDIALTVLVGGLFGDGVDANDITFNKVFPYAATPLNGRNHAHH